MNEAGGVGVSWIPPPESWASLTRQVYIDLQTYRIVGGSACIDAIMRALQALAADLSSQSGVDAYEVLAQAGASFCALKPDTAAYANAVRWMLAGIDEHLAPDALSSLVARRVTA